MGRGGRGPAGTAVEHFGRDKAADGVADFIALALDDADNP